MRTALENRVRIASCRSGNKGTPPPPPPSGSTIWKCRAIGRRFVPFAISGFHPKGSQDPDGEVGRRLRTRITDNQAITSSGISGPSADICGKTAVLRTFRLSYTTNDVQLITQWTLMAREKLREKTFLHSTELSYNRIPIGTVLAGFLPIFCRFLPICSGIFRNFPEFASVSATSSHLVDRLCSDSELWSSVGVPALAGISA